MENLRILMRYFPTGTAEGERDFLASAFVRPADFDEIISPPTGSPRLLVGRKGCGKSAILEEVTMWAAGHGAGSLLIRPDDLIGLAPTDANDIATIKNHLFEALIRRVAVELGNDAAAPGVRPRGMMPRIAVLASRMLNAMTQIDLEKLVPSHDSVVQNLPGLIRSVRDKLSRMGCRYYLLIDDTDQIAALDREEELNRVWGFLLAARKLAHDFPSLNCLVSLRTEVWERLKTGRLSQRDQLDHFRPLVRELAPSDKQIKKILEKRLQLAAQELKVARGGNHHALFFEGNAPEEDGPQESRSWGEFLVRSSRERPRDVIQLVQKLAEHAVLEDEPRISPMNALKAMVEYSRERFDDLCAESALACPQLDQVTRGFHRLPVRCTADVLQQHLMRVPSVSSVSVRGVRLQPNDRDHAFRLWSLLFEVGFLVAIVPDQRESLGTRLIGFRHDSTLVDPIRWNDMQKAAWEVHPAYRPFLRHTHGDEEARKTVGEGAKPARRRRRRDRES